MDTNLPILERRAKGLIPINTIQEITACTVNETTKRNKKHHQNKNKTTVVFNELLPNRSKQNAEKNTLHRSDNSSTLRSFKIYSDFDVR